MKESYNLNELSRGSSTPFVVAMLDRAPSEQGANCQLRTPCRTSYASQHSGRGSRTRQPR